MPKLAHANLVTDFINSVVGNSAQASDSTPESQDPAGNSQTMALFDSSINPDMTSIKDSPAATVFEDDAISPDSLKGTDSEVNSYISSSDKITTYTVKKDDTLGEVASKFGISKSTILYANTNIKNSTLKPGQTLIILPVDGVSYTVKKGDTLALIAKNYKADANDIAEYNDISDKNLQIGDKIIVPGGTVTKKSEPVKVVEKEQPAVSQPEKSTKVQPDRTQESSGVTSGSGITGGYIWPFPSGIGRVSQRLHDDNAYDFAAPKGTPIYAVQDGTVLIADDSGYNGGYGLYVVMDFNDGGQAIFGHMSKVATYAGEVVKQGDIIGYVGSTGRSTGNHVHIGYRGGKPNPYRNLPKGFGM